MLLDCELPPHPPSKFLQALLSIAPSQFFLPSTQGTVVLSLSRKTKGQRPSPHTSRTFGSLRSRMLLFYQEECFQKSCRRHQRSKSIFESQFELSGPNPPDDCCVMTRNQITHSAPAPSASRGLDHIVQGYKDRPASGDQAPGIAL